MILKYIHTLNLTMEIINNIKENYLTNRNMVIGAILFIITSYFGYKFFINKPSLQMIEKKEDKIVERKDTTPIQAKKEYTNDEMNQYIQDEFKVLFKTLTREIKKTSRVVSSLNTQNLFKNDIEKHKLVINSKNITHTANHNTSNYTIYFDNENGGNKVGGYGRLINVIGFRLLKASIPSPPYNLTDNNNKIIFNFGGVDHTVTLTNGFYTGTELKDELVTQLNSPVGVSSITASYGAKTFKFTISHSSTNIYFKWNTNYLTNNSHAYKLFGFKNIDGSASGTVISDYASDLYIHFVDLVIPEIPYITCKKNPLGKKVIERLLIHMSPSGNGAPTSIVSYFSHPTELMSQIYFYPISLNQLTIELYDDSTDQFFQAENMDNSFEFEITILKNPKLMK